MVYRPSHLDSYIKTTVKGQKVSQNSTDLHWCGQRWKLVIIAQFSLEIQDAISES